MKTILLILLLVNLNCKNDNQRQESTVLCNSKYIVKNNEAIFLKENGEFNYKMQLDTNFEIFVLKDIDSIKLCNTYFKIHIYYYATLENISSHILIEDKDDFKILSIDTFYNCNKLVKNDYFSDCPSFKSLKIYEEKVIKGLKINQTPIFKYYYTIDQPDYTYLSSKSEHWDYYVESKNPRVDTLKKNYNDLFLDLKQLTYLINHQTHKAEELVKKFCGK